MTPGQKRRLTWVISILIAAGLAVGLILYALSQNINLFYTPTEAVENFAPKEKIIRLGGMVVDGSVLRDPDSLRVTFNVTDTLNQVSVTYEGILPDLFREGQGIVAQGMIDDDHVFRAKEILAKHDENYMPPEVAQAIQKVGQR